MPELPEVEIVVRNLNEIVIGKKLIATKLWRKDIRFPLPDKIFQKVIEGQNKLLNIHRRAKFIVIEFADYLIISHLGMTGAWSAHKGLLSQYTPKKHDHLAFNFVDDGKNKTTEMWLIYNDPRRFGFVHAIRKQDLATYFSDYGVEPLDLSDAQVDELYSLAKKSKSPVKSFIMNQKNIVGVGNIYACEALFLAAINPFKISSKIKKESFLKLIAAIKKNLKQAISKGGSSIKNYRNVNEEAGSFQKSHLVYGKEKQRCTRCKTGIIQRKVQAGRSTFFCNACQR
ncbi:MAG: bifunctional DNA-formamidopyrimidine glycosylase/DNA-(apurinic or apyrimidinic site) lyase [Bdellovibrionota bacterium]